MAQLVLLRNLGFIGGRQRLLIPITLKMTSKGLHASTVKRQEARGQTNSLQESGGGRTDISTEVRPLGEKIKENTKTASYTAIIVAGLSVTGIMLYAIFRELFSSESPNNIYSDALERVKEDTRVQDAIGAPIKGFGETTRRGRRQHVAHTVYERNGVPHLRMQFYVQGLRNKATVHLESRKTPSGKREYRYLFVQLDHYPRSTIIIEDNRAFDPAPTAQTPLNNALELTSYNNK